MLQRVQSPDHATRTQAEEMMEQAANAQPGPFMVALAGELAKDGGDIVCRQQAGLYLKNLMHAEDDVLQDEKTERWLKVDEAAKNQVRTTLLQCLLSPERVVRHTGAQVIGSVAAIDIPRQQWGGPTGLITMILQCVTNPGVAEESKVAALETCGYVCEELEVDALDPQQTNEILTAIVDGIKEGRPEPTRLAAVKALQNSLDFCSENFSREVERNMLMTVVCDATQSPDGKVRAASFECVCKVAELYYEHLNQSYMDAIYPITVNAINTDSEDVAMMAVEFWSTLCEVEMNLEDDVVNYNYMAKVMPHLMPTLLTTLEKQNEDLDDEDWNLAAAAASAIGLIANTVEDKVVEHVLPYVSGNAASPDWRKREAAIMAFGQILDGPQNEAAMAQVVQQALELLVNSLVDAQDVVKDTAAWTLGRIAQFHPGALADLNTQIVPVLQNIMVAMDGCPKVASSCCAVIHHIAENRAEMANGAEWFGPQFMNPMVEKLKILTDRPDWQEHNLRSSAFEALSMLVENHQKDCVNIVMELTKWVFAKLQASMSAQVLSEDDLNQLRQYQGMLIALLHYIIMETSTEYVITIADPTMQCLLQIISAKSSVATEEAFLAAGKLMDKMEDKFARYLDAIMPFLIAGVQNSAEFQICSAAVGCIGDLCRSVESKVLPYCDTIVQCLLQALENSSLKRDVKPPMLSLFGDMALAIGGQFQRYLEPVLIMLYQASTTTVDLENDDLVGYMNELFEGIIEAYTGIINGLSDDNCAMMLMQVQIAPNMSAVGGMCEFLSRIPTCAPEEEVLRGAVGLVGDIAKNIGKPATPFLSSQTIGPLLAECAKIKDDDGAPDRKAQEMCAFAQKELMTANR